MKPWPWGNETALVKARRIAAAYREHLRAANPSVCAALDAALAELGQTWMIPQNITWDDTDAVTTAQAADLVGRPESVIRRWAATPDPEQPGRAMLPRFGWDGRARTYLVADVRAAAYLATSRLTYHRPDPPPDM